MNFVQLEAKKPSNNEHNIIPLINVVFLMLIFFMVAGVIRETDPVEFSHPQSRSEKPLATERFIINVSATKVTTETGQQLDENALSKHIIQELRNYDDINTLHLILKVDQQLPAQRLHKILNQVKQAGLVKVQLLTEHGDLS